ncbi:MAG: 3'(2'),5'-bisphosphate nucleotidase CysQ family protein [Micavibrio sp.]
MNETFNRITRSDPFLTGLIDPVSNLAREAGAIVMGYHGKTYDIQIKGDESPVTIADKKSSDFLVSALSLLTPGIPVVSEENDVEPGNSAYWAIDPLDGTKEFIQQTGGFCVKIALINERRPVLGVIYCPVQDVLYSGVEHGQAIRIHGSDTRIMQTRACPEKGALSVLFNRKHADPALYKEYRLTLAAGGVFLPVHPKIKPGLPRSMQVAEGRADIHAGTGVRSGSGFAWDIAADDVILTNAGGILFALPTGEKMIYDRPRDPVPAYLALGDPRLRTKLFPAPENH